MIETKVFCDGCGAEITNGYPGEDLTVIPERYARKEHHGQSEIDSVDRHICQECAPVLDIRGSEFYRASGRIAMMLLHRRMRYELVDRGEFPEDFEALAAILDDIGDDD